MQIRLLEVFERINISLMTYIDALSLHQSKEHVMRCKIRKIFEIPWSKDGSQRQKASLTEDSEVILKYKSFSFDFEAFISLQGNYRFLRNELYWNSSMEKCLHHK